MQIWVRAVDMAASAALPPAFRISTPPSMAAAPVVPVTMPRGGDPSAASPPGPQPASARAATRARATVVGAGERVWRVVVLGMSGSLDDRVRPRAVRG